MKLPDYLELLTHQPQPAGITFGRPNGDLIRFTEPGRFRAFLPPPPVSGIYVVLVPDSTCKPRKFRPLYFGEAEILSTRVNSSHERYADWCGAASGVGNLFVAFHFKMGSSEAERKEVESDLIAHYRPECNKQNKSLAALYDALLRVPPPPRKHVSPYVPSSGTTSLASLLLGAKKRNPYVP